MKPYLALAAVLVIAACGSKADSAPAADPASTPAPAVADDMAGMPHDSIMVRDTASQ